MKWSFKWRKYLWRKASKTDEAQWDIQKGQMLLYAATWLQYFVNRQTGDQTYNRLSHKSKYKQETDINQNANKIEFGLFTFGLCKWQFLHFHLRLYAKLAVQVACVWILAINFFWHNEYMLVWHLDLWWCLTAAKITIQIHVRHFDKRIINLEMSIIRVLQPFCVVSMCVFTC